MTQSVTPRLHRPFVQFFIISLLVFSFVLSGTPAHAENATPYDGTQVIHSNLPFDAFLAKLKSAIGKNKMGIVAEACADCGARKIGVTIAKNRVVMIYHPRFAVQMLNASIPAGIEAPLRLYVTEQKSGTQLTYRLPSKTFAPYGVPKLDIMAKELDGIFASIVADTLK